MKETFYRYEMPVKQPAADAVAADLGRFNGEGEDFMRRYSPQARSQATRTTRARHGL